MSNETNVRRNDDDTVGDGILWEEQCEGIHVCEGRHSIWQKEKRIAEAAYQHGLSKSAARIAELEGALREYKSFVSDHRMRAYPKNGKWHFPCCGTEAAEGAVVNHSESCLVYAATAPVQEAGDVRG